MVGCSVCMADFWSVEDDNTKSGCEVSLSRSRRVPYDVKHMLSQYGEDNLLRDCMKPKVMQWKVNTALHTDSMLA